MEILTLGLERTPRGQCLNRSLYLSTLYIYEVQRLKSLTLLAVNGENVVVIISVIHLIQRLLESWTSSKRNLQIHYSFHVWSHWGEICISPNCNEPLRTVSRKLVNPPCCLLIRFSIYWKWKMPFCHFHENNQGAPLTRILKPKPKQASRFLFRTIEHTGRHGQKVFNEMIAYNCCEESRLRSRLIQVAYVTTLGCLCPKTASFNWDFGSKYVCMCMYVCMSPHLPRFQVRPSSTASSTASLVRSQSIWKKPAKNCPIFLSDWPFRSWSNKQQK